jgi:hypothetical protein
MLFANLGAFKLQQVLGAVQGFFQGAVGIVQKRRIGQAPLLLLPDARAKRSGCTLRLRR